MKNVQVLNTNIIEISQAKIDSTAKEVTMLVHKINSVNENGLDFLKEYTEIAMKSLINKPVVCKYKETIDDLGGHEHVVDKKTGKIIELNTIPIGTITDVWVGSVSEDDGMEALFAKATLWSYKYPKILDVIERNFKEGICASSVEVEIHKYNDDASQEYRYGIDFTYLSNCLLGQSTSPADIDAGVLNISDKEIAQAVKHDLEINNESKGGHTLSEVFNKGIDINYHSIEVNALKLSNVSTQIYNILNPLNPQNNSRQYNYYIRDVYVGHVICESERDYTELWKIPYSITNDQVVISSQDEWVKGSIGFIPEGVNLDDLQSQVVELNDKILKLQEEVKSSMTIEELQVELSTKENEIAEFKAKVDDLEQKVTELNETIVSQESTKKELEVKVTELNSSIEELSNYKEQVETAEKEAKVKEINEKYSKLLPEDVMKADATQSLINELKVTELNELVVNEVAKQKQDIEVNEKGDSDVTISSKKPEDLLPNDVKTKYGLSI